MNAKKTTLAWPANMPAMMAAASAAPTLAATYRVNSLIAQLFPLASQALSSDGLRGHIDGIDDLEVSVV